MPWHLSGLFFYEFRYSINAMNDNRIHITVPEEYHLERVDTFLTGSLETDFSRSYIQKLIKNSHITVNESPIKQNYRVKADDCIILDIPEPEKLDLISEDIPLDILFEDTSIAVINKPSGLVVHPGPGNWTGTLVNGLLYHMEGLSSIGGVERPGIVHRLDRDTSGLMVIAKNDRAHRFLVEEFSGRRVKKRYRAVVTGRTEKENGTISEPIDRHPKYRHKMTVIEGGREAVTDFSLDRTWNTGHGLFSELSLRIHTGRTHQIRVHLSWLGNPVVGDPVYSKKWKKHRVPHLLLASVELGFRHPETGEDLLFHADVPGHMKNFIQKLEREAGG